MKSILHCSYKGGFPSITDNRDEYLELGNRCLLTVQISQKYYSISFHLNNCQSILSEFAFDIISGVMENLIV